MGLEVNISSHLRYKDYLRTKWFEIQSTGAVLSVGVSWGLFLLECFLFRSCPDIPLFRLFLLHTVHTVSEILVDKATRRCKPVMLKPLVLLSFLVMSGLAGNAAGLLDASLSLSFFWSLVFFISAGLSIYPQKTIPALVSSVVVNGVFLQAYFSVNTLPTALIAGVGTFFLANCAVSTFASSQFHRLLKKEYFARERSEYDRERLMATLQAIGDGVITTDVDGKVVLFNGKAEEMTGLSSDTVQQTSISEALPWLPLHQLGVEPTELRLDEGGWISVTVQSSPRGERLVSFQNITARKEAEQSRMLSARMESLSLLAGEIAHNFNNIFTVIQGRTSLLRENHDMDQEVREALEGIEQATVEAEHLATQLLTFSPGGDPVMRIKALPQLIKESLRLALAGSDMEVEYRFPPDLYPVKIDRQQFEQVLRSVALNALEASPAGGILSVSAENLHLQDREPVSWVGLRFSDNGPGMELDTLSHVLDPYFTTKPGGKGLGLTAAHSILVKHGGSLKLDSIPGSGTTVMVELPGIPEGLSQTRSDEREAVGKLPRGGKVLIMDDEEAVRKVIGKMLQRLGFRCTETERGEDAVIAYEKALNSEPFSCVILDLVVVDGMGGEKTLAELKKIDPDVAAIVASGYANESVMADYESYGFKGCLPKPFGLSQLRESLAEVYGEYE